MLTLSISLSDWFLIIVSTMASITFSASAALSTFNLERLQLGISVRAKRWGNLFFPVSGTKSSISSGASRSGLPIVGALSADTNRGTVEVPQGERVLRTYVWLDKQQPRVCIIGGGFGGLYTALRLESLVWPDDNKPQVLLVDQSDRFVFKPMLYELLSGEVDVWEIAPRFSDLLANTGVQFLQDRVKRLQPLDNEGTNAYTGSSCGGTVLLESGLLVEYDWLVLALGAETKVNTIPGAAEFAFPFSTLADACKVDENLRMLERKYFGKDIPIRVAIVGCGYSGVELAATLSERLKDKGLVQAINVDATILPNGSPGNREAALKVLSSSKVQLFLGYFVRSITKESHFRTSDNDGGAVQNATVAADERLFLELQPAGKGLSSQILEVDLVLWTAGSKPLLPQLESHNKLRKLPLNARGQAEIDETLRVKGHPRIFAIGDSSALRDSDGRILPATAQVAFQQADFTGWNLWAAINQRPLLPFRFQNLGEMMTLGRNDAAISPSFIEGLTLEGAVGHTARKIAYLFRFPTNEHRFKVVISWITKSAVDSVASLQSSLIKFLSGT